MLWSGSYDPTGGARMNLAIPVQSLAFLFLVFGPLWLPGLMGYWRLRREQVQPPALRAMVRAFPWAVVLTLAVVVSFARVREIRILYVLSIWLVPFSLLWLYRRRAHLAALLKEKYFALWVLALLVAMLRLRVWLFPPDQEAHRRLENVLGIMFTGFYHGPQAYWIPITLGYLFLFMMCVPLALPLRWPGRGGSGEAVRGGEDVR